MDDFTTPILPKGRGLWLRPDVNGGSVGRPHGLSAGDNTTVGVSYGFPHARGFGGENVRTSTPDSDVNAVHRLTDMMGQLGAQIGESIVAKLMSAGVVNMSGDNPTTPHTHSTRHNMTTCDSPHVTVHVAPDRDFPSFKGDGSDKHSVQDWVDLTKTYLKKKGTPLHEQAEEVTSHLLGKAKDVVKIAIRGDPGFNATRGPNPIYDILLRYFSDTSSCLPLADFYATLPKLKENPVDYWIRLNKAADRALEGLRRLGNKTSDLNNEVAIMFV